MRTPVSVLLHYKYSLQLQGKAKAYASSISNKIKCFSWDKWSSWGPGTWNYRWKSASILCKCNLAGSVLTADPAPLRPPPPCSRKRVWRGCAQRLALAGLAVSPPSSLCFGGLRADPTQNTSESLQTSFLDSCCVHLAEPVSTHPELQWSHQLQVFLQST